MPRQRPSEAGVAEIVSACRPRLMMSRPGGDGRGFRAPASRGFDSVTASADGVNRLEPCEEWKPTSSRPITSEFSLPSGGGNWKAPMRRSATSAHDVLKRHPWACGLMMSIRRISPARLRYMESLLIAGDEPHHLSRSMTASSRRARLHDLLRLASTESRVSLAECHPAIDGRRIILTPDDQDADAFRTPDGQRGRVVEFWLPAKRSRV